MNADDYRALGQAFARAITSQGIDPHALWLEVLIALDGLGGAE